MNILLVGDDEKFLEQLTSKLVFLRKNDILSKSDYKDAQNNVILKNPDVILICENTLNDETIDLIKIIRRKTDCLIILAAKNKNQDFILSCYDLGIDDFVCEDIPDYELVIRLIHNKKYNTLKNKNDMYFSILKQMKVVDKVSGVYNYDYAGLVTENYINTNNIIDGSFMAISPSHKSRPYFSAEDLLETIQNNIRKDDILTFGKELNYYLFMPNTDMNGAVAVLSKINSKVDFEICGGISDIRNKPFKVFERDALKALGETLTLEKDFTFAENESFDATNDWLDDGKNYKLFKQMYSKKLQKVVAPVFYKLQSAYEEKLFDTEIDQYACFENCVFSLKSKKGNSSLKMVYPGFNKVIILITHEGLDSPENREIQIPLSKITQREMVYIVEDFIKEYRKNVIG